MRPIHTSLLALLCAAGLAIPEAAAHPHGDSDAVYSLRHDTRRCAFPLCGGWWLSAVNHRALTCADGTQARECYVAEIDWRRLGWSTVDVADYFAAAGTEPILVYGTQVLVAYPGTGDLGNLRAIKPFVVYPPAP